MEAAVVIQFFIEIENFLWCVTFSVIHPKHTIPTRIIIETIYGLRDLLKFSVS